MRRAGCPWPFPRASIRCPCCRSAAPCRWAWPARSEWFIVTLRAPLRADEVLERLDLRMPDGMKLVRAELLPLTGKVVSPAEELFQLRYADPDALSAAWRVFADAEHWELERETKQGGTRVQDVRPLLRDYEFRDGGLLFTLDWREAYLSPLTLTRAMLSDLDPLRLELVKLARFRRPLNERAQSAPSTGHDGGGPRGFRGPLLSFYGLEDERLSTVRR